jgi:hypothetical protein
MGVVKPPGRCSQRHATTIPTTINATYHARETMNMMMMKIKSCHSIPIMLALLNCYDEALRYGVGVPARGSSKLASIR